MNSSDLLPLCGFIAQLVEHRTSNAEVMGWRSNPRWRLLLGVAAILDLKVSGDWERVNAFTMCA